MSHIVQDALAGRLHPGACNACPRNLVRQGVIDCRGKHPLNGAGAAAEFGRNLSPRARVAVGL